MSSVWSGRRTMWKKTTEAQTKMPSSEEGISDHPSSSGTEPVIGRHTLSRCGRGILMAK
jgi:hypothetical protein